MKELINNFMDTRERIIKNSVLNKLLIAKLNSVYTPFTVGTSLVKLTSKGRRMLSEQKGEKAKLPKFVMADVMTSLSTPYQLGYSYSNILIWTSTLQRSRRGEIAVLKSFASQICASYQMNATRADRIFSKIPNSLIEALKQERISSSYWRTGVKRELKDLSQGAIYKNEINKYYSDLQRRLSDWRIFNTILISLSRDGFFSAKTKEGELTVRKTPLTGIIKLDIRYATHIKTLSAIVPYSSLTPENWEKLGYDIDIFSLRRFFK